LLDDAIREHLELKRRRGADPDEVAREQREALDSAAAQPPSAEGAPVEESSTAQVSGAPLVDPASQAPVAAPTGDAHPAHAAQPESAPDAGSVVPPPAVGAVMGETAELDMSSVLGKDAEHEAPVGGYSESAPVDADSLEWEMPGDAPVTEHEEPDEDVLEETPDFLRETPEQERLWFEQRPPRDFDFEK